MKIELDLEVDNTIDATRLKEEFTKFPVVFFRYMEMKVNAELELEKAKSNLSELRALKYKEIKSSGEKITEKHLEACLEADEDVMAFKQNTLDAKHDYETLKAYVESLRAKKDCLIQLGADSRLERG